jgi:hydrogenase maturation protein HypF
VADLGDYRRAGQLRYTPLPGADLAARRPWRAALGYLSLEPDLAPLFELAFRSVRPAERAVAAAQIERGINSPRASSMGRLFDAAAAVIGLRCENRYEGQAAMELESLAGRARAEPLPFPLERQNQPWVMDPLPLLAALGERALAGHDAAQLAAGFHESVALTAALLAERVCEENQIDTVALGGGVFQNARLTARLKQRLEERRLKVLLPIELSPNDGAISYGQAAVAACLIG